MGITFKPEPPFVAAVKALNDLVGSEVVSDFDPDVERKSAVGDKPPQYAWQQRRRLVLKSVASHAAAGARRS